MKIEMKNICSVKWDELEEDNNVRKNCNACHRKVYDFTNKSEGEIITFLKDKKERICAKILTSHLSNLRNSALIVLVSGAINMGCNNKISPYNSYGNNSSKIELMDDTIIPNRNGKVRIKGTVLLEEEGEAIGANVVIKHRNKPFTDFDLGTVTEYDGTFILEGEVDINKYKDFELVISYTGFEDFSIPLEKVNMKSGIKITLTSDFILGEIILKDDFGNT